MIVIEDSIHAEQVRFSTFADAVAELRRRAQIPWDRPPNRCPCTAWRTCGREYDVLEYDAAQTPWRLLRRVTVLRIAARGVTWTDGFEEAWERPAAT